MGFSGMTPWRCVSVLEYREFGIIPIEGMVTGWWAIL